MRRLLLTGFVVCFVATVLMAVAIVACLLLAIWGDPAHTSQMLATAAVLAFVGICTGGGAGFISVSLEFDYPKVQGKG